MQIPVRICILGDDVHSQWGCAFAVSHIPIPGKDVHSQWGTFPFLVRMCNTGGPHTHSRWGCAFVAGINHRGIHILTSNEDVPHWKWGRASLGMHILIGSGDVTHPQCTSSLGMYIITGNAHSLYEVLTIVTNLKILWFLENLTKAWIFISWKKRTRKIHEVNLHDNAFKPYLHNLISTSSHEYCLCSSL